MSFVVLSIHALRKYFRSGWAFLVPYLLAYLLYAWLKFPVNPVASGTAALTGINGAGAVDRGQWAVIPPLLHLFWAFHAINLILGTLALRAWWMERTNDRRRVTGKRESASAYQHLSALAFRALPWLLLVLIFYIPGPYLEWPSDPWEHWARINAWKAHVTIGTGAGWYYKVGHYFFAYSLLGRLPFNAQVQVLPLFHTGMSLLLCWQLFRLARVCGVSRQASMLFVVLQALLFGNDIFGFYRYYSLSSTIPALVGAMAATRCFLIVVIGTSLAARRSLPGQVKLLGSAALAALFAAHHHLQGLAIAGIGMASVTGWAIFRRWRFRGLVAGVFLLLLANLAVWALWPKHPYLDTIFRQEGWLNAWYGFDVFAPGANGTRRVILILGLGGVLNLVAGLILLRRNHVVGWLTCVPLLVLEMPLGTIPLANTLANVSPQAIVVFHRALLAIPAGLALVVIGAIILRSSPRPSWIPLTLIAIMLISLCATPPSFPCMNRTWHAFLVPGQDLTMRDVLDDFYANSISPPSPALVLASGGVSVALKSFAPVSTLYETRDRLLHSAAIRSPASDGERMTRAAATESGSTPHQFVIPSAQSLVTPRSQAAIVSRHWLPDEVALAFTRQP